MNKFFTVLALCHILAIPANGEWKHQVNTDPMDDSRSHIIFTTGPKSSILRSPILFFVCPQGGDLQMGVSTGDFLGGAGEYERSDIMLRVDGNTPFEVKGFVAEGTPSIARTRKAEGKLMEQMREGRIIRVRVTDFRSVSHDGSFSLEGFTRASNKISKWCKMPFGWNGVSKALNDLDWKYLVFEPGGPAHTNHTKHTINIWKEENSKISMQVGCDEGTPPYAVFSPGVSIGANSRLGVEIDGAKMFIEEAVVIQNTFYVPSVSTSLLKWLAGGQEVVFAAGDEHSIDWRNGGRFPLKDFGAAAVHLSGFCLFRL